MTSPFLGEFLGTAVLIVLGNGVVANVLLRKSKGEGSGWIVITAGWSFAVLSGVFTAIACGSKDAHLNPAVTLGFAGIISGDFAKLLPFAVAQMLGAMTDNFGLVALSAALGGDGRSSLNRRNAQQRDLAAMVHVEEHVGERLGHTRHLEAHVEALGHARAPIHDVARDWPRVGVDRASGARFARQLKRYSLTSVITT